jgi:hypothetical protein
MISPPSEVDERLARAIVGAHGHEGARYVQHRRDLEAMRQDPTLDQESVDRFFAAQQVIEDAKANGETLDLVAALRRLEARA